MISILLAVKLISLALTILYAISIVVRAFYKQSISAHNMVIFAVSLVTFIYTMGWIA